MASNKTAIIEDIVDEWDGITGEVTHQRVSKVLKSELDVTDQFVKVSKYLDTIFAFKQIPLNLVPISQVLACRMAFRTNIVDLFKEDKEEIAQILGVSVKRVEALINNLKKYDILRATPTRGKFAVNPFLYSMGNMVETRDLQALFDFDNNYCITYADMEHKITGEEVKRCVANKKNGNRLPHNQIPGQMSFIGNEDEDDTP